MLIVLWSLALLGQDHLFTLVSASGRHGGFDNGYDEMSFVQISNHVALGGRARRKQPSLASPQIGSYSNQQGAQLQSQPAFNAPQIGSASYSFQQASPQRNEMGGAGYSNQLLSPMQNQPQLGGSSYMIPQGPLAQNQASMARSQLGGTSQFNQQGSTAQSQTQTQMRGMNYMSQQGSQVQNQLSMGSPQMGGMSQQASANTIQPQEYVPTMMQPPSINMMQPQAQPSQGGLAGGFPAPQMQTMNQPQTQLQMQGAAPQLPQMPQMQTNPSPEYDQVLTGEYSQADIMSMAAEQQRQEAEAAAQQSQALAEYVLNEENSKKEMAKEWSAAKAKEKAEDKARKQQKEVERQQKRLQKTQNENAMWTSKHAGELAMFAPQTNPGGAGGSPAAQPQMPVDSEGVPLMFGKDWKQYLPGAAKEAMGVKAEQPGPPMGKPQMNQAASAVAAGGVPHPIQSGMLSAMSQMA